MDNKTITTIRVNKFALMGCSQSPRDVTTANLRLVKNVVGLQKSDQELRVSYKPTRFSGWVVDEDFDYHRPEKELFDSFENEQPRNWKGSPKKNVRRCLYFALYAIF